ncbi:hypothetical protein OG875_30775 [Streptomyces sp. NBC_01498]|uniref:hypothetical protein n=1 Tax=Streptomyces sp. NBC_01498 TaxID=2975870 RepID=UPI002E7B6EA5|nr:hypothetical protein [Streptomyces sp. NBC_01498]WTL28586.1 hypothetical protein OG875_30775 [Streptomyces sp. NBC_01498]
MTYPVEPTAPVVRGVGHAGDADAAAPRGRRDETRTRTGEVVDRLVGAASPGRVVTRATRTPNNMPAGIRHVPEDFLTAVRDMPDGPGTIGVALGRTLVADAGPVISRTTGRPGCTVTPTWRRPPDRTAR